MARSTARRLGDVKHPEGHQRITERSCRNPSHISNHKTGKWWEIHGNILISNVANLVATSIYINPVWHDSQGRTLNSLDTAPQKRRKPFWRLEPRFAGTARVAQLCCKVSSLLDRAQRRERPLDKCCSTRRTAWENAAFQATTAFPILQLWSKITKRPYLFAGFRVGVLCTPRLAVQHVIVGPIYRFWYTVYWCLPYIPWEKLPSTETPWPAQTSIKVGETTRIDRHIWERLRKSWSLTEQTRQTLSKRNSLSCGSDKRSFSQPDAPGTSGSLDLSSVLPHRPPVTSKLFRIWIALISMELTMHNQPPSTHYLGGWNMLRPCTCM